MLESHMTKPRCIRKDMNVKRYKSLSISGD